MSNWIRLDQSLAEICSKYPHKTALQVCEGGELTFLELDSLASRYAAALGAQDVGIGDRVGIISGHDVHAIALFWGISRLGAVSVWLNDDAGGEAFKAAVDSAQPSLVIINTSSQLKPAVTQALNEVRCVELKELSDSAGSGQRETIEVEVDANSIATIIYTSGSSGRPKGVSLTHRNLLCVARSVAQHMPTTADDSYLMVVPLHYVHGIMQLLVHTLAGATIYFYDNFVFPRSVVEKLRETEVRGFSGVPFHFHALVDRGGLLDAKLPNLRWMTVTGGKLAADRIEQILDNLPRLEFHIAYGQTECAPRATALHPSKTRTKPDSVGSPIPRVSVDLLDDSGNLVQVGEVGEVVVSGDNIMAGYWQDPEATAFVIDSQGRLHTGDLGRFDDEGDLFLVGRKSELIKSAGERIVPEELERLLACHEMVADVVVVGAADELYGQRVVAHIVRTEGAQELAEDIMSKLLKEHCLLSVPIARAPREFHFWPEFPRKANGKADRTLIATSRSAT